MAVLTASPIIFPNPVRIRRPSLLPARSSLPLRPLYVADTEASPAHPAADALIAAIRRASPNSPVDVSRRIEKGGDSRHAAPTPDFLRLCIEQLDLFRAVVHPSAVVSVYVRPAESYVMDQLELHRVVFYPGVVIAENAESVVLVATFSVPASLRATEAALLTQQVDVFPEYRAVVLPMVSHPFLMGFLVAEIPFTEPGTVMHREDAGSRYSLKSSTDEFHRLPTLPDRKSCELQHLSFKVKHQFTEEQISRALLISRSLAMAYITDQRLVLLQQSSWQDNVRMGNLVEQIRSSLLNNLTLTEMLSLHGKCSEISNDIIEDILVQGRHMKETLQKMQDAVYFTKANIVRYNEEALKKLHDPLSNHSELWSPPLPRNPLIEKHDEKIQKINSMFASDFSSKDSQMPMPPLVLAPQQRNIRPCDVSEILEDLVGAVAPLANKQKQQIELKEDLLHLQVAVEESPLRRMLSILVEGALLRSGIGGKVQIFSSGGLAGGVLVLIDDDGPDMQYMTQMHSLTPFGVDLYSNGMVEDNMTWNFVAGTAYAREMLESYGCVLRVISPRMSDTAFGTGGTRIELWLPTFETD